MPDKTIELLKKGQDANTADKFRKDNLVCLPSQGTLIVTGDIHGHRLNFQRTVTFADLEHNPQTHVVLHEIIHGGPEDEDGGCLSYQLLFDVIRYKLQLGQVSDETIFIFAAPCGAMPERDIHFALTAGR